MAAALVRRRSGDDADADRAWVAVTVMPAGFGGSESLPDGEGSAPVEFAPRGPSHSVAGVELDLVDDEEVGAQAHRVRRRQLVQVAGAIEPRIGDRVVEETELEDVAHEREAILEVHRHQPAGVLSAE